MEAHTVKGFIVLAVLVLVALTVWSVCFTVHETQYAIVTRFGDPVRVIEEPGFQVKWVAPIETVVHLDKRLLVLDLPRPDEPAREFLTEDKKNIEVSTYTAWRIAKPLYYLETVGTRTEAEANLGVIVASELGKVLGKHTLSALLSTDPEELEMESVIADIFEVCKETAAQQYGIELMDFRIKRINFPDQNRNSVFQRMKAERKRIATRYRSEGEEEAADKQRTEILARAYRKAKETEGRAEAEATRIYAEAYSQDAEFYEFLRTLESYEKSLTKGTTLVLPADSPYLRLLITQGAVQASNVPAGPVRSPAPRETDENVTVREDADDQPQPSE